MSQWRIFLCGSTSVTMANLRSVIMAKKSRAVTMAKTDKITLYPLPLHGEVKVVSPFLGKVVKYLVYKPRKRMGEREKQLTNICA